MTLTVLAACGAGDAGEGARDAASHKGGAPETAVARPRILVLGTSLTAGLGVPPDSAYPALLQRRLDAAGLRYEVVNAGVSGETSAGGLRRAEWLFRDSIAVLVLELGANDGLRGTDPDSTRANLRRIIELARARFPDVAVVLAGMEAPPNLGSPYTARFRTIFPDLARASNVVLIPFLLEGVAGIDSLNQADGIHPNPRGHSVIAEHVWTALQKVL